MIFDRFRGVLDDTVSEGTHFRIPWVQTPHIMDIRTRAKTISSVTGTKGGWLLCNYASDLSPHDPAIAGSPCLVGGSLSALS